MARPAPAFQAAASPAVGAGDSDLSELISFIPFVSLGLIALLVLIFAAEQAFGFEAGPLISHRSLVALGGSSGNLVLGHGQWWRPITAILLHGGVEHLVGNCIALFIAGVMLERRLGRAWFAAVFVLGGLAGEVCSLAAHPPNVLGVGASGAIMALLVPSLIEAFGHETVYTPKRARRWVLAMVVSALLPTHAGIDYSAHAGGAIVGGALGYLLLFAAPELHDWARGRMIAAGVAGAGAAAAMVGFVMVALNYPTYAADNTQLIPDRELATFTAEHGKASLTEQFNKSTELEARYPSDPRVSMFRAIIYEEAGNYAAAEAETRTAMARIPAMPDDIPGDTMTFLHGLLAAILLDEGRAPEARTEARSLCQDGWTPPELKKLKDVLKHAGACG